MNAFSPAWDALYAEARAIDMVEVAGRLGAQLRRGGADWIGACPLGCASTDGFVVTPAKGIFLCRPSGATGDAVDMACHCQGFTKAQALEFVTGRDLPGRRPETDADRQEREERRARAEADNERRRAEAEREAEARRRRDEEAVADVLSRAVPIFGTHAEAYLNARGLKPARRFCGDLKFVAELDYFGRRQKGDKKLVHLASLPAMVAIIRNAIGEVIGIHQTYLDAREPRKWTPIGAEDNPPKKVRGEQDHGMIRLGWLGEKLSIGEGVETTLAWHALGYGPEDVSIAAAINLGNLSGRWTGTLPHPTRRNPTTGKPTNIPNGIPDMSRPGVILPPDVREVILLGDGDSEPAATRAAIATAARRFMDQGRTVAVHFAPAGADWNDVLRRQLDEQRERAA